MKKTLLFITMMLSFIVLIACDKTDKPSVSLTVNETTVSLEVGQTKQLTIETNDELGYTTESSNTSVATVNETGLITALNAGEAKVKVQSKTDTNVYKEVTVTVTKIYTVSLSEVTDTLFVGETYQLVYTANDDVTFTTSNQSVVTVSNAGLLTLVGAGEAQVTITSVKNTAIKATISIVVYDPITDLVIEVDSVANAGTQRTVLVKNAPAGASNMFVYETSDVQLATVDQTGKIKFLKVGTVDVTVKLAQDDSVFATKSIEIRNEMIVDSSKKAGDTVEIAGLVFVFGERLFASIDEAFDATVEGTKVNIYAGEYTANAVIKDDLVEVTGLAGAVIKAKLSLNASDIKISNVSFAGNGSIEATEVVNNLVIKNNKFENLSAEVVAIKLSKVGSVVIESNVFTNVLANAIEISEANNGLITIHKNTINGANVALTIDSENLDMESEVIITRNDISNVKVGFDIQIKNQVKVGYARFNSVQSYTDFAAKSAQGNNFDFTLNYWGQADIDQNKFENISERYLKGNYATKSAITAENKVVAGQPLAIIITNPIDEIEVNASFRFTWEFLPYEIKTATVRFITSNPEVLLVTNNGTLDPKMSGIATITARLSANTSINTPMQISVTTDPGIDLTPSKKEQGLIVGQPLKLTASPFPYTIKDETVLFESSHPEIATIDAQGNITSLQAGEVKFTAKLASDQHVIAEYFTTFYTSLDSNNLLDLLTMNQLSYTQAYTYTANGTGFAYTVTQYESVSRFYFDELEVNTSKMVPVSSGIRPGSSRNAIPAGLPRYNDKHVYWVIIHDTANTDPSSSALSHANYLYNAAMNGTVLNTSWHYTIDDYDIYQHIPEDEVAYHAGDGSNLPGQGSYTGGGNRNGIGIETSVAQNDDLYRVWQRSAKFAAEALVRWNLPRTHLKYHRDFSGKICPNVLITSGLIEHFELFTDVEYKVALDHANAAISFESHNTELLDNTGRIVKMPTHATNVSYTITVTENGNTVSRTFSVLLPGTVR